MTFIQKIKQVKSIGGFLNLLRKLRSIFYSIEEKRLIHLYKRKTPLLVSQIKNKETIKVVFFASTVSLWRYQHLYEAMKEHPRFQPFVVLSPANLYNERQQSEELDRLRDFFYKKKVDFIDYQKEIPMVDVEKDLHADIVFYPQPYRNFLVEKHDFMSMKNVLIAYYPYAFWDSNNLWGYNLVFHNIAWRLFYSTEMHYQDAVKWCDNKGSNVAVVGYPNADEFLFCSHKDVWKPQDRKKKRVIWAPHFTIFQNTAEARSNFLEMADFMVDLSKRYKEQIQFAFKPHPRLKTELYNFKEWGVNRTDTFYDYWKNAENCQLEEGDFINLFMTSDAMIHDSGSFSIEYHYTLNPAMYVAKDINAVKQHLCDFGKLAIDLHYIASQNQDIDWFIQNVVLMGKDEMRPLREKFYKAHLLPPNGKTVAQNTIDNILNALC